MQIAQSQSLGKYVLIGGFGSSMCIPDFTGSEVRGRRIVQTREPGGTPLAEKIRCLFQRDFVSVPTALHMMRAMRLHHHEEVILPALGRDECVVNDVTDYFEIAPNFADDESAINKLFEVAYGAKCAGGIVAVPTCAIMLAPSFEVFKKRWRYGNAEQYYDQLVAGVDLLLQSSSIPVMKVKDVEARGTPQLIADYVFAHSKG